MTAQPPVDARTVEDVVRAQLSQALGGRRGMLEGALPTLGFTVTYLSTRELRLALGVGIALAVTLLVVRVVQRQPVQFVVNSLVGIGIAAIFAARSGKAEDVFLPGIIYNAVYAVLLTLSVLVRWPLVGVMIGSVTGDLTAWRADPGVVRLCSRLTWMLVLPCAVRVAVQYPLYLAGEVGWLGVSKIALGWPLQVAALAAMVWLLARGHTPLAATPQEHPRDDVA
ncbi:MAG: DUF3159 domain-containing protein [Spirochaetaceae bacterium]|nr:DUF3159 domain-containing protein [Spirochaetaceae bacterium]